MRKVGTAYQSNLWWASISYSLLKANEQNAQTRRGERDKQKALTGGHEQNIETGGMDGETHMSGGWMEKRIWLILGKIAIMGIYLIRFN